MTLKKPSLRRLTTLTLLAGLAAVLPGQRSLALDPHAGALDALEAKADALEVKADDMQWKMGKMDCKLGKMPPPPPPPIKLQVVKVDDHEDDYVLLATVSGDPMDVPVENFEIHTFENGDVSDVTGSSEIERLKEGVYAIEVEDQEDVIQISVWKQLDKKGGGKCPADDLISTEPSGNDNENGPMLHGSTIFVPDSGNVAQ